MTSLEIVRNEVPFSHDRSVDDNDKFGEVWKSHPERLIEMLPLSNPAEDLLSSQAFEMMKLCWQLNPAQRPHMRGVQEGYSAL